MSSMFIVIAPLIQILIFCILLMNLIRFTFSIPTTYNKFKRSSFHNHVMGRYAKTSTISKAGGNLYGSHEY